MILAIITLFALSIQILRIIYLLFQPKFLNAKFYGNPKKLMLLTYYLVTIYVLGLTFLESIGLIKVEITNISNTPSIKVPETSTVVIIIISSIVAGTIAPYILKFFSKRT